MRGPWLTTLAIWVAAAGATVPGLACYKPNIKSGTLKCNFDAGPNHMCPEGFKCDTLVTGTCVTTLPDAGPPPTDAVDASDAEDVQPTNCFDARPACVPSDAACDPFCITGCACGMKCAVSGDGGIGCIQIANVLGTEMDPCDPSSNDTCGPGLVCMNDACAGRCYRVCRDDNDCPNSFCTRSGPGGLTVCDVQIVDTCNPTPVSPATPIGCGSTQEGCYISSSHPTHTVCDCTGTYASGTSCTGSRSCLPGLACVNSPDGGPGTCQQVCEFDAGADGGAGCPAAKICQKYYGSNPDAGISNPTYGYCATP